MRLAKLVSLLPVVVLLNQLSGCATSSTDKEKQDQQRLVEVAKINTQLGLAYLDNKNLPRAKQKLLLALKQDPTLAEPWYALGYFYQKTGEYTKANSAYLHSIKLAPMRGDVQNNYGVFLCSTGNYAQSIKHFVAATKDSNYLDVADAYENAGFCSVRMLSWQQALNFFQSALQQDPERRTALYQIANINYQLGKFNIAKDKIKLYVKNFGTDAAIIKLASKMQVKLAQQTPPLKHLALATNQLQFMTHKHIQL